MYKLIKKLPHLAGAAACIVMCRAFVYTLLGYELTWIEPNPFIAGTELIIFGSAASLLLYEGMKYE